MIHKLANLTFTKEIIQVLCSLFYEGNHVHHMASPSNISGKNAVTLCEYLKINRHSCQGKPGPPQHKSRQYDKNKKLQETTGFLTVEVSSRVSNWVQGCSLRTSWGRKLSFPRRITPWCLSLLPQEDIIVLPKPHGIGCWCQGIQKNMRLQLKQGILIW